MDKLQSDFQIGFLPVQLLLDGLCIRSSNLDGSSCSMVVMWCSLKRYCYSESMASTVVVFSVIGNRLAFDNLFMILTKYKQKPHLMAKIMFVFTVYLLTNPSSVQFYSPQFKCVDVAMCTMPRTSHYSAKLLRLFQLFRLLTCFSIGFSL